MITTAAKTASLTTKTLPLKRIMGVQLRPSCAFHLLSIRQQQQSLSLSSSSSCLSLWSTVHASKTTTYHHNRHHNVCTEPTTLTSETTLLSCIEATKIYDNNNHLFFQYQSRRFQSTKAGADDSEKSKTTAASETATNGTSADNKTTTSKTNPPIPPKASSSSSSSASKATTYEVTKLTKTGQMVKTCMQTSELLNDSSINARDLFSLQLTSQQELLSTQNYNQSNNNNSNNKSSPSSSHQRRTVRRERTLSAILPRGKEIVIRFGVIRAVIGTDYVWILDAHSVAVTEFTKELGVLLERVTEHPEEESYGQPFEMVVMESILRDTTNVFHRRIRLYEPIVDSFLNKVANEVFSDSGVHLLVPLKDSLQGFEMHVKQCLECLTELLNSDEDMLALLITEQLLAQESGVPVDFTRHCDVELMLEEYGRQLNNILLEVNFMLQRLQSKQEFVQLALSSYRNRMIRMNLYMSISGLSLGIGTAMAGFFGMNLISGLESHPTAFGLVVSGTVLVGATVAASCMHFVSGSTMQRRAQTRLAEIETLTMALSDMTALDVTIKKLLLHDPTTTNSSSSNNNMMMMTGQHDENHHSQNANGNNLDMMRMSREEFRTKLEAARISKSVTDAEVDLLFHAFDQQKDGMLFYDDFATTTTPTSSSTATTR